MQHTLVLLRVIFILLVLAVTCSVTLADGPEWKIKGYDLAQTHYYPYGSNKPVDLNDFQLEWYGPTSSILALTANVLGSNDGLELISWDGQTLTVFSNDGIELSSVTVTGHTGYVKPIVADVTGDGISEIICWSEDIIWVYDGNCNLIASYSGYGSYYIGAWPEYAMDFDQDGSTEIVVSDGSDMVSIDYKTGIEDWRTSISTYGGRYQPIADINNDGIMEIIPDSRSGGSASTTAINLQDGDILFNIGYGSAMTSHAIANLGSSSGLDVVCFLGWTYYSTNPFEAIVYNEAGNELGRWTGPIGRDIACWAIADFDGDSYNELLVCTFWNASTSSDFRLFIVDDDMKSIIAQDDTLVNSAGNVYTCAVDITGDGNLEILVTDKNAGMLRVLDGQLQQIWSYPCAGLQHVALSDLNEDGIPEIILAGDTLNVLSAPTSQIKIAFDIEPGSCPNPLNVRPFRDDYSDVENGNNSFAAMVPEPCRKPNSKLPAAILGTKDFDVRDIDPSTIVLEGVSPLRWDYEDVSTPVGPDADECECTSLGPDGYDDLILKFDKGAIVAAPGDVYDGQVIPLTISGQLYDGTEFEGVDCVVIKGSISESDGNYTAISDIQRPVLFGNYPNPFNPETEISYSLAEGCDVRLEVFNIVGQRVVTLVDEYQEAGVHRVTWDSRGKDGRSAPSGIYLYRLSAGEYVESKKMILMK